jgi:hypothetical protein
MSCCRLRNHQRDCLPNWRLDSSEHTIAVNSKIITENWVAADSETIHATASPAEAWIRPHTQSLLTLNHQRKLSSDRLRNHQRHCFDSCHVDSSSHKVPINSEIASENWVAADSKTINETDSQLKPGFVRARSPYWLGKYYWKLSCCRLRNHQW